MGDAGSLSSWAISPEVVKGSMEKNVFLDRPRSSLPGKGRGAAPGTWENIRKIDTRDLGGGIRWSLVPNLGGEGEVLLKYGVRSLHRASTRCARAGRVYSHTRFLILTGIQIL